jgi:hypothetical protein
LKKSKYANYGRYKETDRAAAQAVLQDMLQVWWQEPNLCLKMQEMPRKPDEVKEQDAGSKEIEGSRRLSILYLLLLSLLRQAF